MKLEIFKNIELDIKDLKSLKDYFEDGHAVDFSLLEYQQCNQIIDKIALEVFNQFQREWDIDFCHKAFVDSKRREQNFEHEEFDETDDSDRLFENGGINIWEWVANIMKW